MFLRGVTAEQFGFKNGEGITDLVDSLIVEKEKIMEEIIKMGVMSDFEPARKQIESYPGEDLLFVIDKTQQYGEMFLLCYTEEAREEFDRKVREQAEALEAQAKAEAEAKAAAEAAEYARLNVVYEDKPIEPRPWETESSMETMMEVDAFTAVPYRETVSIEITRPKEQLGKAIKFYDRNADASGISEFRGVKDPNFKNIVEKDTGFQAAAAQTNQGAQTTWNRLVNKSIQYTKAGDVGAAILEDQKESLLMFLEKALVTVENSLQQNESVDIFNDTFVVTGDDGDDMGDGQNNDLKELKNFGDPTYSKFKSLVAIDWVPSAPGLVAVSAVDNISFDQRTMISGKIKTSHLLVWDFRQLVKPAVVMSAQNEILCFRFNKGRKGLVVGGCITGQVCMWDIEDALKAATRKKNDVVDDAESENDGAPIAPILVSSIDHSHKKAVTDIMWLPADTQINYRGNLVAAEHLDGQQYQFVTISGDAMIYVWDTRYEKIAKEELKHIGRPKHVPTEKQQSKGEEPKLLWAPIFRAPLKRAEGVGELSLSKLFSPHASLKASVSSSTSQSGHINSHLVITTEEGDLLYVDLSVAAVAGHHADDGDDKDETTVREFIRWSISDHVRPAVAVCMSPFFTDIILTVSDACFHLWQVGKEKPLYVSPNHSHYLTAGAWSPTRPSVVILSDTAGHLQTWDFSDTSSKPSLELKATHERISSLEFMPGASSRQQLVAIGDDVGTTHVYELPRTLCRPVANEEKVMRAFLDKEWARIEYIDQVPAVPGFNKKDVLGAFAASGGGDDDMEEDEGEDEQKAGEGPPGTTAAAAPPADAGDVGFGDDEEESPQETAAAKAAAAKAAAREQAKKEEEEFLKMEEAFIAELGLSLEEVPEGLRGSWKAPE